MRLLIHTVLAAVFAATMSVAAAAADFVPDRMVKLIVPVGAGSGVDLLARAIASQLEKQIGQTIIVENKAGAGGIIGTRELLKSAPDGYTLGWASNSYMVHNLTNEEVEYKWPDDFVLAHRGATVLVTVMVNSKVPANNLQELIAYAKENPGKLKAANSGLRTQSHISGMRFQKIAGVEFVNVPYKTSTMMAQALMTGEADVALTVPSVAASGLQTGDIKLLAVAEPERTPLLDGLPTLKESGVDMVYNVWQGYVLPKGTPVHIAEYWHGQIAQALEAPEVKSVIEKQKAIPQTGTREEMMARIDAEVADVSEILEELDLLVR